MFAPDRWTVLAVAILTTTALLSCGDDDADRPPDAPHESAFADGKADELIGACERTHIVLLANDPATDADTLVDRGVHRQAADHIEDARTGGDDRLGTAEDHHFRDIHDLDDVPYVGTTAMHQLAGAVDDYCEDRPWLEADAIFSPRPYTEGHIDETVSAFEEAEESIDLAIYAISDDRVFAALEEAADRGVALRVLYDGANGDHLDVPGSRSARLEDLGADVRYVNRTMHHKFAIVDGAHQRLLEASDSRLMTGSANLSFAAVTDHDEHTAFHRGDPILVLKFQREFNRLWNHSRNIDHNDDLEYFETLPVDETMIPATDDLELLLTSANFQKTDSARWGPGFSPVDFEHNVADRLVELIENADSSIRIAARFLRSRPIAEALMRRWNEQPRPEVRIYLDQVEYVSPEDHDDQVDELQTCLEEAGDDKSEIYDCEQPGFLFSHQLHELGIPLRFKTYAYHWRPFFALQMHHKYLIVDDRTVATGSYNYSHNAETNSMENVVVYRASRYTDLVDAFVDNFEAIWETGRDQGRHDRWLDQVRSADDIELIVDEPVALKYEELNELRSTIRQRCPDVEDEPFSSNPEEHRTCEAE